MDLELKDNYRIFPTYLSIDFVGYKHFYSYKLLRKSSYKRFKKSLIQTKKQGINIKEKNYYSAISLTGWLGWANTYNFAIKYLFPIVGSAGMYYELYMKSNKKKLTHTLLLWNKYTYQYKKHLNKKKKSHTPIHIKNRRFYIK